MNWNVQTADAQISETPRDMTLQWLLTALLGGMLLGVRGTSYVPQAVLPLIERFFCGLSADFEPCTLWDVFLCSELPMMLLLLGMLLCGLCAVGQPFAVTLLIIRGFAVGILCANTLRTCGIRDGLMRNILLLPTAFLSAVLLGYAAKDALALSTRVMQCLRTDAAPDDLPSVRKKIHRNWLILIGLSLAISMLHTALLWLLHAGILKTP